MTTTPEERAYRDSLTGAALIHYHMEHYADDIESDGEMDAGRCLREAWRQHAIIPRADYDVLLARVEKYERALRKIVACDGDGSYSPSEARSFAREALSRMHQENGGGK